MSLSRRDFMAASGLGMASMGGAAVEPGAKLGMGILLYSYGIRTRQVKGLSEPATFAKFCQERGAAGVQVALGNLAEAEAKKLRDRFGDLGIYLEGIVRAPANEKDLERFESEIHTAAACGASVVRTVLSPGRRYEVFAKAEDYQRFTERAHLSLKLAEPVVRKHKVQLAVENHKDFRVEEMAALMRRFGGEFLGVCLDTGNNIALLDDPLETAKALAPWTTTVHLKDMGVEESREGFLLSEVPLGKGLLDLKVIIAAVRKANPRARFNLEMITRDPLSIPCLTDQYWATMEKTSPKELARMLAWVRAGTKKEPLPRISRLPIDEQIKAEDRHVSQSFEFFEKQKLLSAG